MNFRTKMLLGSILVFSSVAFLFHLKSIPDGFYQNEAAFGYNAFSLFKTGKDEYGKTMPVILESFGDYKLAMLSYYLIPFILIFGLTETAVRVGSVFAGLLIIFVSYFIAKMLLKSTKVALLSTFLLSITPWIIVFSRTGNETILGVASLCAGFAVWLRWRHTSLVMFPVALFFGISVGSHYSTWLPVLFLMFCFSVYAFWSKFKRRLHVFSLIFLLIPVAVMFIALKQGNGRMKQVSLIEHGNVTGLVAEQVREDASVFPLFLTRTFHNKLTYFMRIFTINFLNKNGPEFLFIRGDAGEEVYRVPDSGVLYIWMLPFILLGAYFIVRRENNTTYLLIFGFILSVMAGNALSVYGSESQRTLSASFMVCMVVGYGIWTVYRKLPYKVLRIVVLILFIPVAAYQYASFLHRYSWHEGVHQPWYRNYGVKNMLEIASETDRSYKKVYIAGNPYMFYYFYKSVDPVFAQDEAKMLSVYRDALNHQTRTSFGPYAVLPIDCPAAGKMNILFICRGTNIPRNTKILRIIRYPDGQPAYTFLVFEPIVSEISLEQPLRYMEKYRFIGDNQKEDWLDESSL
jgi:4-amino-4-deoxy-L-arabinose transferase-like glycosyltransferase